MGCSRYAHGVFRIYPRNTLLEDSRWVCDMVGSRARNMVCSRDRNMDHSRPLVGSRDHSSFSVGSMGHNRPLWGSIFSVDNKRSLVGNIFSVDNTLLVGISVHSSKVPYIF